MSCLADIARNMGVDISEEIILGLSTGQQFKVETDKSDEEDGVNIECADMRHDENKIRECLGKFGIQLNVVHPTSEEQTVAVIKDKLSHNMPVMVSVDIHYLDYHIEYGKKHGEHDIAIFRINESEGWVYIADNYIQTITGNTFKGKISMEHLFMAMQSAVDYTAPADYIISLEQSKKETILQREAVCNKIKESADKMLDTSMEGGTFLNSIHLLKKHLTDMRTWKEDMLLCKQLEQISLRIVGYAGPVPARLLYARFLEWASETYSLHIDSSLIDGYIELSKQWKIVGNLLIKMIHVKRQSIWQRIMDRLDDIEKLELTLAAGCCESIDSNRSVTEM